MAETRTLEELIEEFTEEYATNPTSPEAISSLIKTFKSTNITIQNWNTLISFVEELSNQYGASQLLPEIINALYESDLSKATIAALESEIQTRTSQFNQLSNTITNLDNLVVHKSGTETITGKKSFSNDIDIKPNFSVVSYKVKFNTTVSTTYTTELSSGPNGFIISVNKNDSSSTHISYRFDNSSFNSYKLSSSTYSSVDLGTSSYKWKNLYLSGAISNGTYSIAVNKIANIDNVVKTADVTDVLTSTSTNKPLSANQGRILNQRIDDIKSRGRFLSVWNATTGKPADLPGNVDELTEVYQFNTGDYYIVGTAGNKMPIGTQLNVGTTLANFPSTTGSSSSVNDTIVFNGATWELIHTPIPSVTFGSVTGEPTDNLKLSTALANKQDTLVGGTNIKNIGDISLIGSGSITKSDLETILGEVWGAPFELDED